MNKKQKEMEYLNFLFSSHKLGTKLGLERISFLLKELGSPQYKFKTIHIAGTNGKGSNVELISRILIEHGFKTAAYISPHIKKFSERIKINEKEISDKDLIKEIKKIKKIIEKKQKIDSSFQPTFFEFSVAIAYNYFARKKVDYAVIETGLGGRLDATNLLKPEICIITNISKEHTNYLGDTIEKIAGEKAEIIKPNSIAVTGETKKNVLQIIRKKAKKENVKLFEAEKECTATNYSFSLLKQKFDLKVQNKKIKGIELSMLGKFQLKNVFTAVLTVKKLAEKNNFSFSKTKTKKGLKKAFVPGRFQLINKNPLIVFDAGHNPACFKKIKETLQIMKKKKLYKKLIILIALSSDKEIEKISKIIFPLASKIIITQAKYRGMELEKIAGHADKYKKGYIGFYDSDEAFDFALTETEKKDLLLAVGSIFFLGEINVDFV